MSTYKKCDESVSKMAAELMKEFESHELLVSAKVKVDFIFAFARRDDSGFPVGNALRLHGKPARGICRILPLKQRQIGRGDAEISLDGDWWCDASPEQKRALLDHELHHLTVRTKNGMILRDEAQRPLLKMRRHDVDFGWFAVIAERHGEHSGEREQAKQLMQGFGQSFWPQILGKARREVPA